MEKIQKLLALSIVATLFITACSSPSDDENVEETTEETVVMVENAPEGCPEKTTITVMSPEAGEVTYDSDHSWYTSWDAKWGTFYFMNWDDFDPAAATSHEYAEGDVKVSWDLKTEDESPVVPGTWNYRAEEENNQLTWLNISTIDLAGAVFDDNGKVEITYYGEDYVCGSVSADDGSSSMSGEFIAKFHQFEI
jgi:hypothetical protein